MSLTRPWLHALASQVCFCTDAREQAWLALGSTSRHHQHWLNMTSARLAAGHELRSMAISGPGVALAVSGILDLQTVAMPATVYFVPGCMAAAAVWLRAAPLAGVTAAAACMPAVTTLAATWHTLAGALSFRQHGQQVAGCQALGMVAAAQCAFNRLQKLHGSPHSLVLVCRLMWTTRLAIVWPSP